MIWHSRGRDWPWKYLEMTWAWLGWVGLGSAGTCLDLAWAGRGLGVRGLGWACAVMVMGGFVLSMVWAGHGISWPGLGCQGLGWIWRGLPMCGDGLACAVMAMCWVAMACTDIGLVWTGHGLCWSLAALSMGWACHGQRWTCAGLGIVCPGQLPYFSRSVLATDVAGNGMGFLVWAGHGLGRARHVLGRAGHVLSSGSLGHVLACHWLV